MYRLGVMERKKAAFVQNEVHFIFNEDIYVKAFKISIS